MFIGVQDVAVVLENEIGDRRNYASAVGAAEQENGRVLFHRGPHTVLRLPARVHHETKRMRFSIANSSHEQTPCRSEPLRSGLKETRGPRPSIGWTVSSPCPGICFRL